MILNSLPKSYLSFLSHFRMTKLVVNYHGLLKLLQIFEKDHQLHKEVVNLVRGSSSNSCHPFKKEKKIRRCLVLGVSLRNSSSRLIKVIQSTFFARSKIIEREIILSISLFFIRTDQRRRSN